MAQIQNNFTLAEAPPGIFYPQDFSLNKLDFITASGQKFNIKKLMVEMSFYEDIYSFCTSGSITIRDASSFIEILQLVGNEMIEIDFGKIKGAPNNDNSFYHVYKIGKRVPTGNFNDEFYTIHFCSEELYLSEQLKISKSFKGKTISEIVKNILTNYLKVSPKKIGQIEETYGTYSFVIPRFKPFEAISWLSTYARPVAGKGSDFLFYENRYGFNFRSIQTIYKDNVYATYKYQQKNLSADKESPQDKASTVIDYEFVKTYDTLEEVASGTFANKLISLDPLQRKSKITVFDFSNYQKQAATLNGKPAINLSKNRLGTTQNQAYDSVIKVAISNSDEELNTYIKQSPGSVAKDIYIETYVPNRTAQLSLANYTLLKIVIPGDPGVTVGSVINFNLLSTKPTDTTKDADKFYSGKYLVTAVRHIFNDSGSYITVLEIAKDSVKSSYANINEYAATIVSSSKL